VIIKRKHIELESISGGFKVWSNKAAEVGLANALRTLPAA